MIKSLRGSDVDAALYWAFRMLDAGEDPLFIARRLVIFAAKDVGNADPQALQVSVAAKEALHFVGMPEGFLPLAQAVIYLASAPKSNATLRAAQAVREAISETKTLPVPLHLRGAPTPLMKGLGYGSGYQYPHDAEGGWVEQDYLPEALKGRSFYEPTERGYEAQMAEYLRRLKARKGETPPPPGEKESPD
jgi:putative ATPase